MLRHALPGSSILLACLLCLGCFSTIAPDSDKSASGGSGTVSIATVRGKVLLFRDEGQWDSRATGVQVIWLAANGIEIAEVNVRSNDDGIFAASTTDRRVAQVQIAALKCSYDSNDPAPRFTCCLDPVPCPGGCESPWDNSYRLPVVLGATAYRDLRVNCRND